jgi:hypothetical protein
LFDRARGQSPSVHQEALETVRVTAQRVHRFAADVERDPSDDMRALWRASMDDLRAAIREARAAGCDTEAIQAVTGEERLGRFVRVPVPRQDAVPAHRVVV